MWEGLSVRFKIKSWKSSETFQPYPQVQKAPKELITCKHAFVPMKNAMVGYELCSLCGDKRTINDK